mgnify:CR=1 FL=1
MDNNGFKVKVFDMEHGLVVYDDVKSVRIISDDYNLLIMKDYLSILGEINGSVNIKSSTDDVTFDNIRAFYMNSNNIFNLMIKDDEG